MYSFKKVIAFVSIYLSFTQYILVCMYLASKTSLAWVLHVTFYCRVLFKGFYNMDFNNNKKKQSHEHNYEFIIQYIGVYTQVILTCPNIRQDVVAYIEILEIFGSNQHFLGNYWHVVVG